MFGKIITRGRNSGLKCVSTGSLPPSLHFPCYFFSPNREPVHRLGFFTRSCLTDVNGAGTRDEPLPLAKQSTGYAFTNGYKNFLNESGDECCKSSSRLSRKSFVRFNNGAKLFEQMLIIDLFTVYDPILAGGKQG